MLKNKTTSRAALIAILCLVPTVRAEHILDHAFIIKNKSAIKRANAEIENMARIAPYKSMLIETIDDLRELPFPWQKDIQAKVKGLPLDTDEQKERAFKVVADYRIEKTKLDGVYVLICLNPQYVLVTPTESAVEFLPPRDAARIQSTLVNAFKLKEAPSKQNRARRWLSHKFRKKNPKRGIEEAVSMTHRYLMYNTPVDDTGWRWAVSCMTVIFCSMALLGMIRARLRKRYPDIVGVRAEHEAELPISPMGGSIGTIAGDSLVSMFRRSPPEEPPSTSETTEYQDEQLPVPS